MTGIKGTPSPTKNPISLYHQQIARPQQPTSHSYPAQVNKLDLPTSNSLYFKLYPSISTQAAVTLPHNSSTTYLEPPTEEPAARSVSNMCNKYIFDYSAGCGCGAREETVLCEEVERGQECKGIGEGNEPGVPQVMKEALKCNECRKEAEIAKAMKLVGA
jgi:hypothetical protein